jgi:hypothetical protein
MDLVSLLRIMIKWWVVVVPMVVLTIIAAVIVNRSAEPLYEASGSVLVATPAFISAPGTFQDFNIAEIAATVRENEQLNELRAADELTDYTIDDGTDGLIQVIATGTSGIATERTADTVAALVVDELLAVQERQGVEEGATVLPRLTNEQAVAQEGTTEDGGQRFVANVGIVLDEAAVEVQNPYSATPPTGRLLQVAVMSAEGRQRVNDLTVEPIAFEILQDYQDRAPILEVSAFGPGPDAALAGFEAVTQTISDVLDERQERAGVPPSQRIVIEVIAAPGGARDVSPPIDRPVAVTIALGLLAAVGAALAAESIASHRQRTRNDLMGRPGDDPADFLWPSSLTQAQELRTPDAPPSDRPRTYPPRT